MSLKEEVDMLRRIPLFAKVDPARLKLLAFTSERLHFCADQVLFRQGDPGDAAYVKADIIVESGETETVVAELGANALVGEMAILCDVPRTATVKASVDLDTLKITKDLFFRLVSEFPEMAVEIMRVLAQRLENTTADLSAARDRLRQAD